MRGTNDHRIPSARKQGLVIQQLEGETLVYDTHQNKAHCLNSNAALIWGHCDGKSTLDDLAGLMQTAAAKGTIGDKESRELVWIALGQLEAANLLEAPLKTPVELKALTRRQVIKAAGVAALVAIPMVSSIIAPKAAQAATCLASGQPCTASSECCSGLCNVNTCA